MKKKPLLIISICIILIGSGVLAFPFISIYFNDVKMDKEVTAFDTSITNIIEDKDHTQLNLDDEGYLLDDNNQRISDTPVYTRPDLDRLLKDMKEYNEELRTNQSNLLVSEESYLYPSLDLTDYGIYNNCIGYISAPDIDMEIPIYLGANNSSMDYGAGHFTYTSFPLGEKSTHVALAAHTGYIGRVFFDNIPMLDIGDSVYIQSFWGKYEYKLISKDIIPSDGSLDIFVKNDRELLTLVTCHRGSSGVYDCWVMVCERI